MARRAQLAIAILDEESVDVELLIEEADECKRGLVFDPLRNALFDELYGRILRLGYLGPLGIKLIQELWSCEFLFHSDVIFL